MLCLWNPQAPALEQGTAPSLLVFHSSQLCLLYTLAQKKQQMARLLLTPPCCSQHPRRLHWCHLMPHLNTRVSLPWHMEYQLAVLTTGTGRSDSPAGDQLMDRHRQRAGE